MWGTREEKAKTWSWPGMPLCFCQALWRYLGKTSREWAPQDWRRPGEGAGQTHLPEGESTNHGYVRCHRGGQRERGQPEKCALQRKLRETRRRDSEPTRTDRQGRAGEHPGGLGSKCAKTAECFKESEEGKARLAKGLAFINSVTEVKCTAPMGHGDRAGGWVGRPR